MIFLFLLRGVRCSRRERTLRAQLHLLLYLRFYQLVLLHFELSLLSLAKVFKLGSLERTSLALLGGTPVCLDFESALQL